MRAFEDLTNRKFGLLTVCQYIGEKEDKNDRIVRLWKCKCDCGGEIIAKENSLLKGERRSCGCINRKQMSELGKSQRKHGARSDNATPSDVRLYNVWNSIIERTTNPKSRVWNAYGGRGITICDEWRNSFESFKEWAEKNGYKDELTIDRINNDMGYTPENCRWATYKQQNNNRRSNVNITIDEETHTLAEWSEISGINRWTITDRLKKNPNISKEELFAPPVRHNRFEQKIEIDGETKTIEEWSNISGVHKELIWIRLKNGWDVSAAIFKPSLRKRQIEINGEVKNVSEWSRLSGVDRTIISRRIDEGWDAYNAVFTPTRKRRKTSA